MKAIPEGRRRVGIQSQVSRLGVQLARRRSGRPTELTSLWAALASAEGLFVRPSSRTELVCEGFRGTV